MMKDKKIQTIDTSRKRLALMADKYYNEGNYLSALRFAYKELETYPGDGDTYTRLSDIYEAMNLHGSAINWWFRFLDIADEEDLPDIYEGLAVNYLNIGNDSASAFYYNRLIDVDDSLPEETKMDIIDAFSSKKKYPFRFVYPPRLVDYSKEVQMGSHALKEGNCKRAIQEFSKVEKGAREYASAKEMQAVAHLLAGEVELAENVCLDLLKDDPMDVRARATLSAVYLEQDRAEESLALAKELAQETQTNTDDLYKVATVCCENGLHDFAYQKFVVLDEKMPFDGRMLYFKAVSAYKSGRIDEAEKALDVLCSVYPDAEVAKYYLYAIRRYKNGETDTPPELLYFYHLPQEERESRCRALIKIGSAPKDEAKLFGLLALHDGYFRWCFDEMDGADHDLQYLALTAAVRAHADEFLRDALLDYEVLDVLKIETLRMLYERNEEMEVGLMLCNIYRKIALLPIKIGRKRRKKFLEAYAKVASKFVVIQDAYAEKLQASAEKLYVALEKNNALDLLTDSNDCACAIFMLSGLKELGNDPNRLATVFDANLDKTRVLLSYAVTNEYVENGEKKGDRKENTYEID